MADLGGAGSAKAVGTKIITLSLPVPNDLDEATPGAYNFQFSLTKAIDILSEKPTARELTEVAENPLFETPAEELSDLDFLRDLIEGLESSSMTDAQDADRVLKRLATNSVWRRPFDGKVYSAYKVKAMRFRPLEVVVAPGADLGRAQVADYVLQTGQTRIPVVFTTTVSVSRSNANAGARAALRTHALDLILLEASLPSPPP